MLPIQMLLEGIEISGFGRVARLPGGGYAFALLNRYFKGGPPVLGGCGLGVFA